MVRPSGTVTFLFTDVEGSTRRWEADAEGMRTALAGHDAVLREAVERHGGWLFKHTGDGVCAAFSSARAAVDAAVDAQRSLELPVRMGIATGEAESTDGDYFGPVLNATARVMGAGHGGQILLAASTAALLSGMDLADLGEHRLRDLSGSPRLFQVRAPGLRANFPPLRTLDSGPGNLPAQLNRFVGREDDVKTLVEVVHEHRLVTLTGVGGVGKTRLSLQVAAASAPDFAGGVWLVELATIEDPAAVPDAVAAALGVTVQGTAGVTRAVAEALSGRRVLIVLDNCEHVLDAAAGLVEALLGSTAAVTFLATSREGLRVDAEHLWPVAPLDVGDGRGSVAVELFVERARTVRPDFRLDGADDAAAVAEACRRLDGIPLAIELAAARMVSMNPLDLLDRLGDRFRLLAGSRRAAPRHQTLRDTVAWSYDLLDTGERAALDACSVFSDGFDLAAAAYVCGAADELDTLDRLDSLVRKSLVTVDLGAGRAPYGMLETIRQFGHEQLSAAGQLGPVRDRHARFFAEQAARQWARWHGPDQRQVLDWIDAEYANLRSAVRWAAEGGEIADAAAIAAHTSLMGWSVQRFEAAAWAEELLPAARAAGIRQLPRLYAGAALRAFTGDPDAAIGYAVAAGALGADPAYDAVEPEWPPFLEAISNLYARRGGRRALELYTQLAAGAGVPRIAGLGGRAMMPTMYGQGDDAVGAAEEILPLIEGSSNAYWRSFGLWAAGLAFAETQPARALDVWRSGLTFAREHRAPFFAAAIARDLAGLEAEHGELDEGLRLFKEAIDAFHRCGDVTNLAPVFAHLAVFIHRRGNPEVAATLCGTSQDRGRVNALVDLRSVLGDIRTAIGDAAVDRCVTSGASMTGAKAVRYAQSQIAAFRQERSLSS